MRTNDPGRNLPIWNSGCAAFMCTVFAGALFEAWNVRFEARAIVHLAGALVFLAQAAAIQRAIMPYRGRAMAATHERWRPKARRLPGGANLVSALLLIAIGIAGIASLRTGQAAVAAVFAVFLWLFPWVRIRMCRRGIWLAGLMAMLGAAAALLAPAPLPDPFLLASAAAVFWAAGAGAWIRLTLLKHRTARAAAGYSASA